MDQFNKYEPLWKTLIRVGFDAAEVNPELNPAGQPRTTMLTGRLLCDPVIAAKVDAVLKLRPGYPYGNTLSIWGGQPESVEYITKHMTAAELKELHGRILTWRINKETGLTEPPK